MRLSGTGGMGRGDDRDPERSAEVVRRAVELGVNRVDTAGFYFSGTGRANQIIRTALAPYPGDLTIATKVGPGRDLVTGEWGDWARPSDLRAHVEHSLETLGLDRLHLVCYRSNGVTTYRRRPRRWPRWGTRGCSSTSVCPTSGPRSCHRPGR
jgi:aryl-alcohol dehydrogenase-like predicted oxidoreductase